MRKDLMSIFNPIWILTIILLLVIAANYALSVELLPNGQIDWSKYGQGAQASTPANLVNKIILTIPACYNVTVEDINLIMGNRTPVTFAGCTQTGKKWYCDCRDTIGDYNLTLQTDGTELYNKYRMYDFTITYTTYAFDYVNSTVIIKDYGPDMYIYHTEEVGTGQNLIYVTTPVYVDRIVNNTINNTIYVDRDVPVDRIVYIDNSTVERNNLRTELTIVNNATKNYKMWVIVLGISTIILIIIKVRDYLNSREDSDEG